VREMQRFGERKVSASSGPAERPLRRRNLEVGEKKKRRWSPPAHGRGPCRNSIEKKPGQEQGSAGYSERKSDITPVQGKLSSNKGEMQNSKEEIAAPFFSFPMLFSRESSHRKTLKKKKSYDDERGLGRRKFVILGLGRDPSRKKKPAVGDAGTGGAPKTLWEVLKKKKALSALNGGDQPEVDRKTTPRGGYISS